MKRYQIFIVLVAVLKVSGDSWNWKDEYPQSHKTEDSKINRAETKTFQPGVAEPRFMEDMKEKFCKSFGMSCGKGKGYKKKPKLNEVMYVQPVEIKPVGKPITAVMYQDGYGKGFGGKGFKGKGHGDQQYELFEVKELYDLGHNSQGYSPYDSGNMHSNDFGLSYTEIPYSGIGHSGSGIGHLGSGIGHSGSGIGHSGSGIGHSGSGIGHSGGTSYSSFSSGGISSHETFDHAPQKPLNSYIPPLPRPSGSYGAPKALSGSYSPSGGSFGHISSLSDSYESPHTSFGTSGNHQTIGGSSFSQSYGPPPSQSYGPTPSQSYASPSAFGSSLSSSTSHVPQSPSSYGAIPDLPSGSYGAPQSPVGVYSSPSSSSHSHGGPVGQSSSFGVSHLQGSSYASVPQSSFGAHESSNQAYTTARVGMPINHLHVHQHSHNFNPTSVLSYGATNRVPLTKIGSESIKTTVRTHNYVPGTLPSNLDFTKLEGLNSNTKKKFKKEVSSSGRSLQCKCVPKDQCPTNQIMHNSILQERMLVMQDPRDIKMTSFHNVKTVRVKRETRNDDFDVLLTQPSENLQELSGEQNGRNSRQNKDDMEVNEPNEMYLELIGKYPLNPFSARSAKNRKRTPQFVETPEQVSPQNLRQIMPIPINSVKPQSEYISDVLQRSPIMTGNQEVQGNSFSSPLRAIKGIDKIKIPLFLLKKFKNRIKRESKLEDSPVVFEQQKEIENDASSPISGQQTDSGILDSELRHFLRISDLGRKPRFTDGLGKFLKNIPQNFSFAFKLPSFISSIFFASSSTTHASNQKTKASYNSSQNPPETTTGLFNIIPVTTVYDPDYTITPFGPYSYVLPRPYRPLHGVNKRFGLNVLTGMHDMRFTTKVHDKRQTDSACFYVNCRVLAVYCLSTPFSLKRQGGEFPFTCGLHEVCCNLNSIQNSNSFSHSPSGFCGVSNTAFTHGRIKTPSSISGETTFGEYPWQAALLRKEGPDNVYMCAGSLIDDKHVITAAHCVNSYAPSDLRLRLGEWDVNTDTEMYTYVEDDVNSIIIHPEFSSLDLVNDVAVVSLKYPIDFTKTPHISPVCLPSPGADFSGQRCFVTGWGKNDFSQNGKYQNILKETDVPVLSSPDCESILKQTRLGSLYRLHPGMFCAGGEPAKDACKGDGGGPLSCQGRDGRYQLAGIVSWGIGCGQPGIPGVYVRVQYYIPWIKEILKF